MYHLTLFYWNDLHFNIHVLLNLRNVLSPHRSHPFPFHCVVDLTTWHYNSRQRNVVSNSQETFGEWTILYKIKKTKKEGDCFCCCSDQCRVSNSEEIFGEWTIRYKKKTKKHSTNIKGKTKQKNKILDNMNACANNWKWEQVLRKG